MSYIGSDCQALKTLGTIKYIRIFKKVWEVDEEFIRFLRDRILSSLPGFYLDSTRIESHFGYLGYALPLKIILIPIYFLCGAKYL
jgi:hypothetical protein